MFIASVRSHEFICSLALCRVLCSAALERFGAMLVISGGEERGSSSTLAVKSVAFARLLHSVWAFSETIIINNQVISGFAISSFDENACKMSYFFCCHLLCALLSHKAVSSSHPIVASGSSKTWKVSRSFFSCETSVMAAWLLHPLFALNYCLFCN